MNHYRAYVGNEVDEISSVSIMSPNSGYFYRVNLKDADITGKVVLQNINSHGYLTVSFDELVRGFIFWDKERITWRPCGVFIPPNRDIMD